MKSVLVTVPESSRKPRIRRLLAGTIATAGLVILGVVLAIREPSHEGKRISEWMRDMDMPATRAWAREAIQHMGEEAVPYVLKDLSATDSPWRLRLMNWATNQSLVSIDLPPAQVRRQRALSACQALGPMARPAIPELTKALYEGNRNDREASAALLSIGPDGMQILLDALQNTNSVAIPRAIYQLRLGMTPPEAVEPMKIAIKNNPNDHFIQFIGEDTVAQGEWSSRVPMEKLISDNLKGLRTGARFGRYCCAIALGRQGAKALSAVPALEKALHDPDPEVRVEVRNALRKIRGH